MKCDGCVFYPFYFFFFFFGFVEDGKDPLKLLGKEWGKSIKNEKVREEKKTRKFAKNTMGKSVSGFNCDLFAIEAHIKAFEEVILEDILV